MPEINEKIIAAIASNTYLVNKKELYPHGSKKRLHLTDDAYHSIFTLSGNEASFLNLLNALKTNTEINHLEISCSFPFSEKVIGQFKELLQTNATITKLSFSHLSRENNKKLEEILLLLPDIGRRFNLKLVSELTQTMINAVAELLRFDVLSALKINDISYFRRNQIIVLPVCEALGQNKSLKKLTIHVESMFHEADVLGQALSSNKNLEKLSLPCGMTRLSFEKLCENLTSNEMLQKLRLGFARIDFSENISASEITEKNECLKKFVHEAEQKATAQLHDSIEKNTLVLFNKFRNLQKLSIAINEKHPECRHRPEICSCAPKKQLEEKIQKFISDTEKYQKQLKKANKRVAATLALAEKYFNNQAEQNADKINRTYNKIVECVNEIESSPYALRYIEKTSAIKYSLLQIICFMEDITLASEFFHEQMRKSVTKDILNKSSVLLAHSFLLRAGYSDVLNEYTDYHLLACAYLIYGISQGDQDNHVLLTRILETLATNNLTGMSFADVICLPAFIELVWPKLIANLKSESLSSQTAMQPIANNIPEHLLDDIHLFCDYMCDTNKQLILCNELWRSQVMQYRAKYEKQETPSDNTLYAGFFKQQKRKMEHSEGIDTEGPAHKKAASLTSSG